MPTKKSAMSSKSAKSRTVEPFTITRTFDAPRPTVIKAWTDVDELKKWWGPKGGEVLTATMDLRPGGLFHYSMRSTGSDIWGKGIIKEVALPDRLVWLNCFSDPDGGTTRHPMVPDWPLELLTTVTFEAVGDKTKVTVVWDPAGASEAGLKAFDSMRDSMQGGWGGSLEVLAEVLAGPQTAPEPQALTPHLTIAGAAKAIDFYVKVFGAKEVTRMPAKDGKRIMHAVITINGGTLMVSDAFPEHDGPVPPTPTSKVPVAVALNIASPADVDAIFAKAIKAGATSQMEPVDQFWGARFAMLTDPFGHRWMLNANNPKS
jgi:uncharacterized glyoxalase superfamily protein PhnB/uncharacterized protein YndB with AHSA1/START domain